MVNNIHTLAYSMIIGMSSAVSGVNFSVIGGGGGGQPARPAIFLVECPETGSDRVPTGMGI